MSPGLNLDTDGLGALGGALKYLAGSIEDAEHPDDISQALERVKVIAEAELPEWLESQRRTIRQYASALAG
jgi:hypothetical protein